MEQSEQPKQRYIDAGELSDPKRDILGAAGRTEKVSLDFREGDGRVFSRAVGDIRQIAEAAAMKIQLEVLCVRLKGFLEGDDKGSFLAVCRKMYDIGGQKWNELALSGWMQGLGEFFDGCRNGSGGHGSFFLCREVSLVIQSEEGGSAGREFGVDLEYRC